MDPYCCAIKLAFDMNIIVVTLTLIWPDQVQICTTNNMSMQHFQMMSQHYQILHEEFYKEQGVNDKATLSESAQLLPTLKKTKSKIEFGPF